MSKDNGGPDSDRELLVMAAKAAGIAGHFVEKGPLDGYPRYSCGIGKAHHLVMLWNPLDCDGDAMRLAVKLKLDVCFYDGYAEVHAGGDGIASASIEACSEDMYESTRRAIVRAAAAIGGAM